MQKDSINYTTARLRVCNQSREWIDRYAENGAAQLGFKPGDDVVALVTSLGGKVHYQNIFDQIGTEPDTIYVHGHRDFDIVLPDHTTPRRDRFTVAHELGHYFLHSFSGQFPLKAARSGAKDDRAEWEANCFAGAFLMPATQFKEVHSSSHSLSWLAEQFGVSTHAAQVRCQILQLRVPTDAG